jgi:hypothetical protein
MDYINHMNDTQDVITVLQDCNDVMLKKYRGRNPLLSPVSDGPQGHDMSIVNVLHIMAVSRQPSRPVRLLPRGGWILSTANRFASGDVMGLAPLTWSDVGPGVSRWITLMCVSSRRRPRVFLLGGGCPTACDSW